MATTPHTSSDVERLQRRINSLARRRQELRARGATRAELEANRLRLVGAQQQLARAAVRYYLPLARSDRAAA